MFVNMPLVQHYSSWKIPCGIADYTADLIGGLATHGVRNEVLPVGYTTNQNLAVVDMLREYDLLATKARAADLIHIQHEYSFFGRSSWELCNHLFTECLKRLIATGKPIVITFHSDALPFGVTEVIPPALGLKARIKRAIKQRILAAYDRLQRRKPPETFAHVINKHLNQIRCVVHTRRTRTRYIDLGIAAQAISVVPMGFKPRSSILQTSQAEARRQLGLPQDITLLSLFGFVSKYKGPLVAAKALKLLPPNYVLALVGGPHPANNEPILEKILRLWRGQDPHRLIITGYVPSELADLWQCASDITLAPYEEVGMSGSAAITWALSSGKPVIASKIHTFREIYEDSGAMFMVTPNCPHELAWAIQHVMKSEHLAQELVRKAQSFAAANSFERVAEKYLAVYRQFPGFPSTASVSSSRVAA